jgi:hypothetical protein
MLCGTTVIPAALDDPGSTKSKQHSDRPASTRLSPAAAIRRSTRYRSMYPVAAPTARRWCSAAMLGVFSQEKPANGFRVFVIGASSRFGYAWRNQNIGAVPSSGLRR